MMIVIIFTKPAGIDPHENCFNYIYIYTGPRLGTIHILRNHL